MTYRQGLRSGNIPRLPVRLMVRQGLKDRLDILSPLTIVRGLTGTGKTTLVAEWVREKELNGFQVVWTTANPGEGSMVIVEALPKAPLGPTIIVIDDAQNLQDHAIVEELFDMSQNTPDLFLVAVSRTYHPLEELATRAHVSFNLIKGAALMVSARELVGFADSWGHRVKDSRAAKLFVAVGGWLQPARLALDGSQSDQATLDFGAASHYCRTVLGDDKDFIRAAGALALADELDEKLAVAITGDPEILNLLIVLERKGILEAIPTQGKDSVWRFPLLIRNVLSGDFEEADPEAARRVYGAIAEHWSNDPERLGEVLYTARDGERWHLLVSLWRKNGLDLARDHRSQFYHAFTGVPMEVQVQFPDLGIAEALIISLEPDDDEMNRSQVMARFRNLSVWFGDDLTQVPMGNDRALAVAMRVIMEREDSRLAESMRQAREFFEEFDNSPLSVQATVNRSSLAWIDVEWATTAMIAGDGVVVEESLNRAYVNAIETNALLLISRSAAQLAMIYAIDGSAEAADRWINIIDAQDRGVWWINDVLSQPGSLAKALRATDRLDEVGAQSALDNVTSGVRSGDFWAFHMWVWTKMNLHFGEPARVLEELRSLIRAHPDELAIVGVLRETIDRCVVDLLLALGEPNLAERHLKMAGRGTHYLEVPRARLALISGDYAEARAIAAAFPVDVRVLLRDRAEISMIGAAAAFLMDDLDEARRVFITAHALAGQIDSYLPYLTIPSEVRDAMFTLAGIEIDPHLRAILDKSRQVYPTSVPLVRLSMREKVVLTELVRTENASEIADRLIVSIHTVKKQIASIYGKLGVHDRASALMRANRLGLISDALREKDL